MSATLHNRSLKRPRFEWPKWVVKSRAGTARQRPFTKSAADQIDRRFARRGAGRPRYCASVGRLLV